METILHRGGHIHETPQILTVKGIQRRAATYNRTIYHQGYGQLRPLGSIASRPFPIAATIPLSGSEQFSCPSPQCHFPSNYLRLRHCLESSMHHLSTWTILGPSQMAIFIVILYMLIRFASSSAWSSTAVRFCLCCPSPTPDDPAVVPAIPPARHRPQPSNRQRLYDR